MGVAVLTAGEEALEEVLSMLTSGLSSGRLHRPLMCSNSWIWTRNTRQNKKLGTRSLRLTPPRLNSPPTCPPVRTGTISWIPSGTDSRSGCQQVSTSWTESWIEDVWINSSEVATQIWAIRTPVKMSWLTSSLEKDLWHLIWDPGTILSLGLKTFKTLYYFIWTCIDLADTEAPY